MLHIKVRRSSMVGGLRENIEARLKRSSGIRSGFASQMSHPRASESAPGRADVPSASAESAQGGRMSHPLAPATQGGRMSHPLTPGQPREGGCPIRERPSQPKGGRMSHPLAPATEGAPNPQQSHSHKEAQKYTKIFPPHEPAHPNFCAF